MNRVYPSCWKAPGWLLRGDAPTLGDLEDASEHLNSVYKFLRKTLGRDATPPAWVKEVEDLCSNCLHRELVPQQTEDQEGRREYLLVSHLQDKAIKKWGNEKVYVITDNPPVLSPPPPPLQKLVYDSRA